MPPSSTHKTATDHNFFGNPLHDPRNLTLANASARIRALNHGAHPLLNLLSVKHLMHHPPIKHQLIITSGNPSHNPRNLTLTSTSARIRASNSRGPSIAEFAFRGHTINHHHPLNKNRNWSWINHAGTGLVPPTHSIEPELNLYTVCSTAIALFYSADNSFTNFEVTIQQ